MASSTENAAMASPQLPDEMWKLVISHMQNEDLKNARLVNTAFKELSTPQLFSHACLSLTPENLENLLELTKNHELSQYVQVLYLDLTTYFPNMTPSEFAHRMQAEFDAYSAFFSPQVTGPLSAAKLLKVLDTNAARDLGEDYLSGPPKTAFVAGYTQVMARVGCYRELVTKDGIFTILQAVFAKFRNLHTVTSVCSWEFKDDYPQWLSLYLRRYLPEKTFRQIPGLEDAPSVSEDVQHIGSWKTPGISARQSHLLCPSPLPCKNFRLTAEHQITMATLRALSESPHIRLKSLSLPGPNCIRGGHSLWKSPNDPQSGRHGVVEAASPSRFGFVSLVTLTSVPFGQDMRQTNLLLPVFSRLKALELQIDHAHPGSGGIMSRYDSDFYRLPRALQRMQLAESLKIGYCEPISLPSGYFPSPPVSLYDTMLYRDEDFEAAEDDGDDGPPAPVSPRLLMPFSHDVHS